MNVTLTPEQENYVRSQLQGGNYNSVQELISEALQLLEERNRFRANTKNYDHSTCRMETPPRL